MKLKASKAVFIVYSILIYLLYFKLIPNPNKFIHERDIITLRRTRGWWQYNIIPFKSYFHINENFPTNLWLIIFHIIVFFIWGILIALAFKKTSPRKFLIVSIIYSFMLEILQFMLAVGMFDIDTIIQHILGSFLGITIALKFKSNYSKNSKA